MNGRREGGEIGNQHFRDCRASGKVVVEHFGRRVGASSLKAADFTALRESFPATWGPGKTGAEIGRIRSIFKWAFESELIPAVPNYGPRFKKPPKAEARKSLAKRVATVGRMSFEADEIRRLLENSTGWLHACILLGINCGFGNKDCGQLRVDHIDFQTGWYDLPRQKTGIDRQCILWQRTLDAIETAKSDRSTPKMSGDDSLCFLTSHGRPVFWESLNEANRSMSRCDNVGKAFTKVVKDCGIRTGRGFYSLRRTFETVAGNSKDQVAVNMVMGHTDESMAEVYRQGIDDKRLKDVAKHVEKWLFGKAK
jgi:integrase